MQINVCQQVLTKSHNLLLPKCNTACFSYTSTLLRLSSPCELGATVAFALHFLQTHCLFFRRA